MYCIVLYCIVLYCIVLYCIVLYCIVLCKRRTFGRKVSKRLIGSPLYTILVSDVTLKLKNPLVYIIFEMPVNQVKIMGNHWDFRQDLLTFDFQSLVEFARELSPTKGNII